MEAEDYVKRTLLARGQPIEFSTRVKDFLTENAVMISRPDCYHLGNSSVVYSTDIPTSSDGELRFHISLDLTAKTKEQIREDLASIASEFPEFEEFASRPYPLSLVMTGLEEHLKK